MNRQLKELSIADPELAAEIDTKFVERKVPLASDILQMMVAETIWGLSIERAFGQAIAHGFLSLMGNVSKERISRYRDLIRGTGESGPTMGRMMAGVLVPILIRTDEGFLKQFLETVAVLLEKGSYTLPPVTDALLFLLHEGDSDGAIAFLRLLTDIFRQPLSYNRSRNLSQIVPKAVCAFPVRGRAARIREVGRVVHADVSLTEAFLDSFDNGLLHLGSEGLTVFVSRGIELLSENPTAGEKFFSMSSRQARECCVNLQVAVPLSQIRNRLDRYLQARTGLRMTVKPLSALSPMHRSPGGEHLGVVSDGKFIYLPSEIDISPTRAENNNLYQVLVRLEAAYYECGTFDFDLEKAMEKGVFPDTAPLRKVSFAEPDESGKSLADLERFFAFFKRPQLAKDLFVIFEQGRIRLWLDRHYPGILRMSLPVLRAEAHRMAEAGEFTKPLFRLYRAIVLNEGTAADQNRWIETTTKRFHQTMNPTVTVEWSAALVADVYGEAENHVSEKVDGALLVPFHRQIRADLFMHTYGTDEMKAVRIQQLLSERNIKVYRSDIRKKLRDQNGTLSLDDVQSIVVSLRDSVDEHGMEKLRHIHSDLSAIDFFGMVAESGPATTPSAHFTGNSFRYREWDFRLQDYLQDHVMVREVPTPLAAADFFEATRRKHHGLIKKIRFSFEMLKPQGLTILRRWLEGDDFDYRALIDYVIDRKAGMIPSERLYIKRLKQERDVCVLLLVDLSRSTANTVLGGKATVLDIEKEAIVLLCEALSVVGDRFSIAGFSGSGRLGVEYYLIKAFGEPMDETIRQRINGITPRRSTRMGAAVRHAVSQLVEVPSKVKLLLLLGDGFPNDTGYKQDYAIEDTRRALDEARSRNIHAHGITVNFSADVQLDALYGKRRHHVIRDIRELPDKLFRIYGALTRQSI